MRITLRGCPPSLNQFVGKVNGNEYRAAKSQWTRTVYYAEDVYHWWMEDGVLPGQEMLEEFWEEMA